LQGSTTSSSPHQQASLTPQMSKKPQMGTHVVQQHQQQQIDPAITPLSGMLKTIFRHYSVIHGSIVAFVRRRAIRDGNFKQSNFHFSQFLFSLALFLFARTETGSSSKLSTFSSTGKTGSVVQMRRTTNKKGKTAPAPPKRTRFD
jgi:hypothetical protein